MDKDTPANGNEAPVKADTADTQPSEASVQAETSTPEATPAPQEATEVKAEDTVEEKLYAGKYKSVEDMERAYQELNTKFTSTSQEKAELAKILNDAFTAPDPAPAQNQESDNYYQEESNPINQDIEKLKVQTTVQTFIMTHENADAEAMGKVLADDPIVKSIPDYQARLEYAYLKSQNMANPKAIEEAQRKSAEAAQAKIAEKQSAQVETARQAAQPAANEELTTSQLRDSLRDSNAFDKLIDKKFPGIAKMKSR